MMNTGRSRSIWAKIYEEICVGKLYFSSILFGDGVFPDIFWCPLQKTTANAVPLSMQGARCKIPYLLHPPCYNCAQACATNLCLVSIQGSIEWELGPLDLQTLLGLHEYASMSRVTSLLLLLLFILKSMDFFLIALLIKDAKGAFEPSHSRLASSRSAAKPWSLLET